MTVYVEPGKYLQASDRDSVRLCGGIAQIIRPEVFGCYYNTKEYHKIIGTDRVSRFVVHLTPSLQIASSEGQDAAYWAEIE